MKRMFVMCQKKIILGAAAAVVVCFGWQMRPAPHIAGSCTGMLKMTSPDSLYEGANAEFSSAGKCDHCHGSDPEGLANVNAEGGDVNLVDDWSSSMMALSAKDPYWRAKVSHEVLLHSNLQQEIETTCTKCHAPLGHFAATMNGASTYSIDEMNNDEVALDGVSCTACHSQLPQPEVALHTGQLFFADDSVAYGPYFNPLVTPMALYSGYTPEHSFHIRDSKLCASCHSLITNTVNADGELTGDNFVEQATWHEWLNSSYPVNEISCQQCHLPQLQDQAVVIATGYDTPPRSPFGLHTLAGGNTTMLKLMRDNREALGIFPDETQFNETIAATEFMLQQQSLQLQVNETARTEDTLYVDVKLTNLTGHKLPSGYPARRMTVVFYAEIENNEEIFRSGSFTPDWYVNEEDATYEPHYNIINSEEQVQIYEMVMGNTNEQVTTVLNEAAVHLKDNRLVPLGFSASSPQYDTTEIVLGITDIDFNHNPDEGSGTDIIHYHIPMNAWLGTAAIHAEVYFQAVPPSWAAAMSGTEEIELFQTMFDAVDQTPVLMQSAILNVDEYIGVDASQVSSAQIRYLQNGKFKLTALQKTTLKIYSTDGKLMFEQTFGAGQHQIESALKQGMYLCLLRDAHGRESIQKVLVR
ncbi:MAG: T9SS type A sorting domain-containing protein [Flavobacteriales bacterium]